MLLESDVDALRAVGDVNYVECNEVTEDSLAELARDAEVLLLNFDVVVNGCGSLSESFWSRPELSALRGVMFDMTGLDWASPVAAASRGITFSNIPHYSSQSVAESVIAEILLHARQRHLAYVDEIKGRPIQARQGINLHGRTIGVIGLGSIGSTVAELASGLGMSVIGWNRSPRAAVELTSIHEVFERSSVVVVALKTVRSGPDSNVGIIGAEALTHANNVIVVNLANASLIDEEAMAEAIKAGKVAAYSLDRNDESLAGPLAQLECVHFAPANAWNSGESMDTLRETWVANALAFIAGAPQNVFSE